jgi:hypothetical protein
MYDIHIAYIASCPGCMHEFTDHDTIDPNKTEHWVCCSCPNCFLPWQGLLTQLQDHSSGPNATYIVVFQSECSIDSDITSRTYTHENDTLQDQHRPEEDLIHIKHAHPYTNNHHAADSSNDGTQSITVTSHQRLQTKGQRISSSSSEPCASSSSSISISIHSSEPSQGLTNVTQTKTDCHTLYEHLRHETDLKYKTELEHSQSQTAEPERFVLIPANPSPIPANPSPLDPDIPSTATYNSSNSDTAQVQTNDTDNDTDNDMTDNRLDKRDNHEQRTNAYDPIRIKPEGTTNQEEEHKGQTDQRRSQSKRTSTGSSHRTVNSYGQQTSALKPSTHDTTRNYSETAPKGWSKRDWLKRVPCRGCGSRHHADCSQRQQNIKVAKMHNSQPSNQTQLTADNQRSSTPKGTGAINRVEQDRMSGVEVEGPTISTGSKERASSHTVTATTIHSEPRRVRRQ